MSAFIEWTNGVIRAGSETKEYGTPYSFVCTVIRNGEEATIIAACGKFNSSIYREIKKLLIDAGIKKVSWERKNNTPRVLEKLI